MLIQLIFYKYKFALTFEFKIGVAIIGFSNVARKVTVPYEQREGFAS